MSPAKALCLTLGLVGTAWADETAVASAPSEPSAPLRVGPMAFSGAFDLYGAWDSDHPGDHRRPEFLYSYARANGLAVNLAMLHLNIEEEPVRAALGLMAGTFANDNMSHEEPWLRNLYEARVGLRVASDTWIDAGIFPSHFGAEGAIGANELALTRSLTAENSPYYLAGARIQSDVSSTLRLSFTLANGWQRIGQPAGAPGIGGGTGLSWQATDRLSVNWSTWVGWEPTVTKVRLFNDTWIALDLQKVDLIVWIDVGSVGRSAFGGGNVQARFPLSTVASITGRVEHFEDPSAVVLLPQDGACRLTGASVNLDLRPKRETAHLRPIWRNEIRAFWSSREIFGAWGHPKFNLAATSAVQLLF